MAVDDNNVVVVEFIAVSFDPVNGEGNVVSCARRVDDVTVGETINGPFVTVFFTDGTFSFVPVDGTTGFDTIAI